MLSRRVKYLQVAINGNLSDAHAILKSLPVSDRVLIEAGTPFIKRYGFEALDELVDYWQDRLLSLPNATAYVVADLKTMDRAETEVSEVKAAGASAAVVLGLAPLETLNSFIAVCEKLGLDSMVDMMNVEQPYKILRTLKKLPTVVILHRGVDEETYNKDKPLPYHNIIKIKGSFDLLISVAGGDTSREVQRAVFNGADIVVVWKDFYRAGSETGRLAAEFLKEIK